MNFPDMESLRKAAVIWKFRAPNAGETEQQYRDLIESCEIRNKVGWDKFSNAENRDLLRRGFRKNDAF